MTELELSVSQVGSLRTALVRSGRQLEDAWRDARGRAHIAEVWAELDRDYDRYERALLRYEQLAARMLEQAGAYAH